MTWMNRKFSDAFGLSLALVLATVLSSRLEAQSEAVSINPPMTFALNDLALSVLSERQGNRITNVNVVGYVDIDIPPGFSMIANHLARRDNSVGELFPGVPEGTTIYKFDPVSQSFSANEFAAGAWTNPDETLLPGEGAFIKNPTTNTLRWTIVGEVLQGTSTNDIPCRLVDPQFRPADGYPARGNGFSGGTGRHGLPFRSRDSTVPSHVNIYGEWLPPCKLTVGEAFFVLRAKAAFWVHTFNISAPIIGP